MKKSFIFPVSILAIFSLSAILSQTTYANGTTSENGNMEAKTIAEGARDIQTQIRIRAGNALYREIVRLCTTGKDIFISTDEALYNDYVLYPSSGNSKNSNSGLISGQITDAATGEKIQFAEGLIEGKEIAVTTDEGGDYVIIDLAPGTYVLIFKKAGYNDLRIEGIMVEAGKETTADGKMIKQ